MLKDINAAGNSNPYDFTICNGKLYFSAYDSINQGELWVTDGFLSGTFNISTFSNLFTSIHQLTEFQEKLFFSCNEISVGQELWVSDGTNAGTYLFRDIALGSSDSNPYEFIEYNNLLYFSAYDIIHGRELWVTNGIDTAYMLIDLNPNWVNSSTSSDPIEMYVFNGKLFFNQDNGYGREMFITDGTVAGTYYIPKGGTAEWNPSYFVEHNGELFFYSHHDNTLSKTDGTYSGTQSIKQLKISARITSFEGKLYFSAKLSSNYRLYTSDGTYNGTQSLYISGFNPLYYLQGMYVYNDMILLNGTHNAPGFESDQLYKISNPPIVKTVELSNSLNVSIFPNPSEGTFVVKGVEANAPFQISSITGEKILDSKLELDKVSLSHLNSGVYLISFKVDSLIVSRRLIIK